MGVKLRCSCEKTMEAEETPAQTPPVPYGETLASVFTRAYPLLEHYEHDKDVLVDTIAALQRAQHAIDRLGFFSQNESLDDVSTGSIRFLLVPHIEAQLLYSMPHPENRLGDLHRIKRLETEFISQCEDYNLLSEDPILRIHQNSTSLTPMQALQMRKDRFKKERAFKAHLQKLMKEAEKTESSDLDYADEEQAREIFLLMVRLGLYKATADLKHINEEITILEAAEKAREEGRDLLQEAHEMAQRQLALPRAEPIHLTRENLMQHVFKTQPRWTVSIEEDMRQEAREAMERQRNQQLLDGERARLRALEPDADSEEAVEKARQEQLYWDEWHESHRRGEGNRMGS
eukprot:gnl/Trimastix_PCT/4340.p1 GENE.gnl/Trimastix_PCT/4340~~gnl/Trimastix_PCT/4340.p1  ORF type:complete len:346 (+),score=62.36 gnl/Trimastix_PCT/4340:1-1038(+)